MGAWSARSAFARARESIGRLPRCTRAPIAHPVPTRTMDNPNPPTLARRRAADRLATRSHPTERRASHPTWREESTSGLLLQSDGQRPLGAGVGRTRGKARASESAEKCPRHRAMPRVKAHRIRRLRMTRKTLARRKGQVVPEQSRPQRRKVGRPRDFIDKAARCCITIAHPFVPTTQTVIADWGERVETNAHLDRLDRASPLRLHLVSAWMRSENEGGREIQASAPRLEDEEQRSLPATRAGERQSKLIVIRDLYGFVRA
jgi:hypothetical protein